MEASSNSANTTQKPQIQSILNKMLINILPTYAHESYVIQRKSKMPPNQIITKEYPLDQKPVIKLITKQQLLNKEKNLNYIPPKIKSYQFEKYAKHFHVADTLGFQYSEHFDQMIYFKYNNEDYFRYEKQTPPGKKSQKYFSGLFIPMETIVSKEFKTNDNISNALGLECPSMKNIISQSFSKNFKGCAHDPMFSSNYPSANLMAVIRKSPFEFDLILENDTNSKAAEWFNFAVKFIQDGTYKFNIINLNCNLPLYQMGMKIPYYSFLHQSFQNQDQDQIFKSGNGWNFGGTNVKFSQSDLRRQGQKHGQNYYKLSFQFVCKDKHQLCMFASSVPYGELDYERFLNRVLYGKVGQHMKLETIDIGESLSGIPIKAYMFFHRKAKSNTTILKNISNEINNKPNEKHQTLKLNNSFLSNQSKSTSMMLSSMLNSSLNSSSSLLNLNQSNLYSNLNPSPKSIVILARQHSGETVSSFVLEGIIQFLMDNTQFVPFKKNYQFVIIPFVNPDGVKYGNQRMNLAGSDPKNSWKSPNSAFQPEVYQIKRLLKILNQTCPISLIIDLQSNSHTLSSFFKFASSPSLSSSQRKKDSQPINPRFFPYMCSRKINQVSFSKSEFDCKTSSFLQNLTQAFPKALVYEFNCSNYGWENQIGFRKINSDGVAQKDEGVFEFNPDIYRTVGRQMISAYLEYIRLNQKNIGINDRLLNEIKALDFAPKQPSIHQRQIQRAWTRDTILFSYPQGEYLENKSYLSPDRSEQKSSKKRNTFNVKSSVNTLSQLRTNTKKKTMPNLRNEQSSSKLGQNISEENNIQATFSTKRNQKLFPLRLTSPQQLELIQSKPSTASPSPLPSVGQLSSSNQEVKGFTMTSSIFSAQQKTQLLQPISKPSEKSTQMTLSYKSKINKGNNSLSTNRTHFLKADKKSSQLSPATNTRTNTQNFIHKSNNNNKSKGIDTISKFDVMKKFMDSPEVKRSDIALRKQLINN